MLRMDEVYQIYEHIAEMCKHFGPSEGCKVILHFCEHEMSKISALQKGSRCPHCGGDLMEHYAVGANYCPCEMHK